MEIIDLKQEFESNIREYVASLPVKITDNESYLLFAGELQEIKRRQKVIDDRLEPEKKKAYVAYMAWNDLIKELKAPLLLREAFDKKEMSAWEQEQERIRREEEKRLQEEARKREEEARLQAAIEAESHGQKEEAEQIIEQPAYVPPVVLPKSTPKVSGISYRDNWTFRITDPNKIPREYMVPNETAIRKVVSALKDKANIPGIEAYNERIVAAGRR
jgi:hypothetical protein